MVYMCRIQESLAAAPCGPWHCREDEEALSVDRLLCSDTLCVRLCRLGLAFTRCTFWRLLGGKGSRLEGLTHGSRSPQPLKLVEFVFLRHAPGSRLPSIRSLRLGRAPKSQAEAEGMLKLGPIP
jgi:hypothetical protein